MEHFAAHPRVRVGGVLTNNPNAGALERAARWGVPSRVFSRAEFYQSDDVPQWLRERSVSFVVLAGFLWLTPPSLVAAFPNRIVNIHPALLPKFGGQGMYGMRVHEAVVAAGEKESGITVHYVNERYDEGRILFQATCPVAPDDAPADVARKVQELEHRYFPGVIEKAVLDENI